MYRQPTVHAQRQRTASGGCDHRKPTDLERPWRGCRNNVLYTAAEVRASLARAQLIDLQTPLPLPGGIAVTAHYAGHVLGACMFHVRIAATDVVYTGDYTMLPDRHLGAARVPRLAPDLLISESTFGSTVRDARRARERELLEAIHSTVLAGGKVLVPVAAIGSAQELSLLVSGFWRRHGLSVRVAVLLSLLPAARLPCRALSLSLKDSLEQEREREREHLSVLEREPGLTGPRPRLT